MASAMAVLAHARLADEDGVVFRPARKNLEYAPYLLVASDDGVEFSGACHLVQVDGIFAQCVEYLFGSLAVYRAAFAELLYRRNELFFRHTAPLEQFRHIAASSATRPRSRCSTDANLSAKVEV